MSSGKTMHLDVITPDKTAFSEKKPCVASKKFWKVNMMISRKTRSIW